VSVRLESFFAVGLQDWRIQMTGRLATASGLSLRGTGSALPLP
jgi:hypothetical protein